jgi:hypothetical protein
VKPTILSPIIKEIVIEYTGDLVELTANRFKEIEDFWSKVNHQGRYHRGEVYTVSSIHEHNSVGPYGLCTLFTYCPKLFL